MGLLVSLIGFALMQKGEPMDDLISRQAAIDAFQHKWDGMALSVFDVINGLPSAQPEIIRCKDCKWWRRDSDHTCKEHSLVSPMLANDFCSRGERKDDD